MDHTKMHPSDIIKKFEELEDQNGHGLAVQLLAEHFEDSNALYIMKRVNEIHKKIGFMPYKLSEFRAEIAEPLYKKYEELEKPEEDKPAHGKQYSLTGPGNSIMNGNTWKESEVKS